MITKIKIIRLHRLLKIQIAQFFRVRRNPQYRQLGFTFIELLAVIVVIGVITLIALSAFQGKRDEAKIAAAWQEMKQLADAEKTVAVYYDYFVPLSVLNDVPGRPVDYPGVSNPDCIGNDLRYYLIDTKTGRAGNDALYPFQSNTTIRDLLRDNAAKWKGPFVNFQRQVPPFLGSNFDGLPLDPWGGPYWLFTWCYSINNDGSNGNFSILTIDRFAIVSFGKDSAFPTADDLIYTFK